MPTRISDLVEITSLSLSDVVPVTDASLLVTNKVTVADLSVPGMLPYATRAALAADVLAGSLSHLPNGTVLMAGQQIYQKQTGATAIADLPGYVPFGTTVSPHHFATLGATDDALAAFTAAKAYLDSAGGGIIDGVEGTFYLSATFSLVGYTSIVLRNIKFKPHTSWVSVYPGLGVTMWNSTAPDGANYQTNPLVLIPEASGDKIVEDCFFDCRDASLNPVADGLLWLAGSNKVRRSVFRGFANFGIWLFQGTNGWLTDNDSYQWAFADTECGIAAERTGAAIVIGTGDMTVRNNVAHGTKWPLYVHGSGACTFAGNHYYNGAANGDVPTAGKTYNVMVVRGSRPDFEGDYFDNGIVRLETAQIQFQSCKFLVTDATYDAHYIEFAPQVANDPLNGLMIHGCDFQGSKGGASLVATADPTTCDFFRIDTTSGTLSGTEDNVIVENNTYHFGTARGALVPSTSGCVRWAIASGAWTLDTGAYKSGNLDLYSVTHPYLFLGNAIAYNVIFSVEDNSGAKPYTFADPIHMQNVDSTTKQFWCASANSVKLHITWDGRNNVLI